LTGGRLEIGLGAGYVAEEYAAAGIEFRSAGARVARLADTVHYLRSSFSGRTDAPTPQPVMPPIMIAGVGDKILTLAAQHADVVALSKIPDLNTLRDRIQFIKKAAGQRFSELEFNLIIFELAIDREPNFDELRQFHPNATDQQLKDSMNALCGSFNEVVAKVAMLREQFGVTYFTIVDPSGAGFADLSRLTSAVR
jgi:probable F420-dependent oxidoreductase